ncbi:MAG TPA: HAD family hydrolase [Jatrophihabitantaceae bacterium]
MTGSISAVFFDVDDTLVDFDGAARDAFGVVFGPAADYRAWTELSSQWHRRFPAELSWDDMLVGRTAAFLQSLGRDDEPAGVEARRMDLIERSCAVFADVAGCLQALRAAGLRLGVITNSDPVHQRRKLASVGLAEAFDVLVISGELGVGKPSPEIFEHACRALGVSPSEALHIGDRLDLDALAAAGAGLRGVWLDRVGAAGDEQRVPVVTTLDALPALVA